MDEVTWESALDDLERQLASAERMIASADVDDQTDWEPPGHLGPLPLPLLTRAQRLLERQQAVITQIPAVLVATRQQLQVGKRIGHATTRPAVPLYLDVTA